MAVVDSVAPPSAKLFSIKACEIFDSRGNPTVDLVTDAHLFRSALPLGGISTGIYEALELREEETRPACSARACSMLCRTSTS